MAKSWRELNVLSCKFDSTSSAKCSLMWGKILLLKYFALGESNSIGESDPRIVKSPNGYMLFAPKAPTKYGQSISHEAFKKGRDYLLSVGYLEKKNIPSAGDKGGRTQIVYKLTKKLEDVLSKEAAGKDIDYDVGKSIGAWNPESLFLATLLLNANQAGFVRNLSQNKLESTLGMKPGRIRSIREQLIKSGDIIFYSSGVRSGLLSQNGSIYLMSLCFTLIEEENSSQQHQPKNSRETHIACYDFSVEREYRQYKRCQAVAKSDYRKYVGTQVFWSLIDTSFSVSSRRLILKYMDALIFSYCLEELVSKMGVFTGNLSLGHNIQSIFNGDISSINTSIDFTIQMIGLSSKKSINELLGENITGFCEEVVSKLDAGFIVQTENIVGGHKTIFNYQDTFFQFCPERAITSE